MMMMMMVDIGGWCTAMMMCDIADADTLAYLTDTDTRTGHTQHTRLLILDKSNYKRKNRAECAAFSLYAYISSTLALARYMCNTYIPASADVFVHLFDVCVLTSRLYRKVVATVGSR